MLVDASQRSLTSLMVLPQRSLRERLRDETDAVHQSLHRNAALRLLVSGQASLDLYMSVLTVFSRFYSAIENSLDFVALPLRFEHEAKPLRWLAQDFAQHPEQNQALAAMLNQPQMQIALPLQIETYLGYLYVKQGSTLGGQAISKQLQKNLGLVPGETQFFFHGFGECTPLYWKEFLHFLAQHEQRVNIESVVSAAKTYFQLLDATFKQQFPLEE